MKHYLFYILKYLKYFIHSAASVIVGATVVFHFIENDPFRDEFSTGIVFVTITRVF